METHTITFLIKTYTGIIGDTLRTVFMGLIATMAIIALADVSQYRLALTVLILTLAIYGILRTRTPMDMISQVTKDMPEDFASTNFGQAAANTPFHIFKIVVAVFLIATAGTQILALW